MTCNPTVLVDALFGTHKPSSVLYTPLKRRLSGIRWSSIPSMITRSVLEVWRWPCWTGRTARRTSCRMAPEIPPLRIELAGVGFTTLAIPHVQFWKAGLPWARETISDRQWGLLKEWDRRNKEQGCALTAVCLHAPIFNPFGHIGDEQVNRAGGFWADQSPLDRHRATRDLVHGTIVEHRAEFIKWATNNVRLVLSGHTHRSGLYDVKAHRVHVRRPKNEYLKELERNPNQTIYAVVRSAGLVGFCNEGERGLKRDRRLVRPAYRLIRFGADGNITSLDEVEVDSLRIREEVRRDYGELPAAPVPRVYVSPGPKYFEVWPWADDKVWPGIIHGILLVGQERS